MHVRFVPFELRISHRVKGHASPIMPKVRKTRQHAHKAVHPNSRRAVQLAKEELKKGKKEKRKAEKRQGTTALIAKLMWFRDRLDESKKFYSDAEVLELIESYLQRHDDELAQLEALQSDRHTSAHYRHQHGSREDALRILMIREREMLEGPGFEAPDLTNPKCFETFLEWKGEENLLPRLVLKKYHRRR